MTFYRWRIDNYSTKIERIECSRETESSLWVLERVHWGGREYKVVERMRRKGPDVHETWEGARARLAERLRNKVDYHEQRRSDAAAELAEVLARVGPMEAP